MKGYSAVMLLAFATLVIQFVGAFGGTDPSHICTEGNCHYSNSTGGVAFAACPGGGCTYGSCNGGFCTY